VFYFAQFTYQNPAIFSAESREDPATPRTWFMPEQTKKIRILLVEDNADNAELIERALRIGGLDTDLKRVASCADAIAELGNSFSPCAILTNHGTLGCSIQPSIDGFAVLAVAQARSTPIPVIFVTRPLGEEIVIRAIRKGAADYILFSYLSELAPAITRALETKRKQEREKPMLPTCSWCRRIRDEHDVWHHIENYLTRFFGVRLTHSICPECYKTQVKPHLPPLQPPQGQ
jgi:CheY-like chemotaxis protein